MHLSPDDKRQDGQPDAASGRRPADLPQRARGRRVLVLLGKLVLALLTLGMMFELGTRAASWVVQRQKRIPNAEGATTILCTGGSWALGAARASYPALLQRKLNARLGRGAYRVLNLLGDGFSSTRLVGRFDSLMRRHKPGLVVLQVGAEFDGGELAHHPGRSAPASALGALLYQLRVVRSLGLLQGEPVFQLPEQLRSQLPTLRGELRRALSGPEARHDLRGLPPMSAQGCPQGFAPDQLLAQVLGARSVDAATALTRPVLTSNPGCRGALVARAMACNRWRQPRCASQAVTRVVVAYPGDPHAVVEGSLASLELDGWRVPGRVSLQQVARQYPAYLRARLALALSQLKLSISFCGVHSQMHDVLLRYPASPWARTVLERINRLWASPAGERLLQSLGRVVEHDLGQLLGQANQRGADLLLLAYPHSEAHRCRQMAITATRRFGAAHGVPLLDLNVVLGRFLSDVRQPLYDASGHPSAAGNAAIARHMLTRLRTMSWLRTHSAGSKAPR